MLYMPNTNISYFHNIFKRLFYKTSLIMCFFIISNSRLLLYWVYLS